MQLQTNSKVSIDTAAQLIMASPRTAFFLEGPPGCGKTNATASILREAGYDTIIVDCQCIAPEDAAALPVVDNGFVQFVSHEKWAPRKKMAIILDEFPKASADVMNTFLPLVFGRPRRYQENSYDETTIVVLTGNSAEFRAGDNMKPHVRNRIVQLNIADPTATQARKTAMNLGWDSRVIDWIQDVPAALVSFDEEAVKQPDTENVDRYFGYDPRFPTRPYVSMRAIETASNLLVDFTNANIEPYDCVTAFNGAIGTRATASMMQHLRKFGVFVPMSSILANPEEAMVPAQIYDQRIVAINCASSTTPDNWETVLRYVNRLHKEVQLVYGMNAIQKSKLHSLARFPKWNAMVNSVTS